MIMFGMVKTGSNSFAVSSGVLPDNLYLLDTPLELLTKLREPDTLQQLCLRVYQSPECEHHRAAGARKRCGPCRNHPEPADHVKRAGGRRADIGGCSLGQWGGDDWGSGISDHHAKPCVR